MSALWTIEQREWLEAMGHDVLSLAVPLPVGMQSEAASATPSAEPLAASTTHAAASLPDTALVSALLRAARIDDRARLGACVGDLEELRRSPRAKRALWPVLRRLRCAGRRG